MFLMKYYIVYHENNIHYFNIEQDAIDFCNKNGMVYERSMATFHVTTELDSNQSRFNSLSAES